MTVFAYFDDEDTVDAVEVSRPESNDDLVRFGDLDVFATTADDLIARLQERHHVVIKEEGCSAVLPDLSLAFWRPGVPESRDDEYGRYFESVLVSRSDTQ